MTTPGNTLFYGDNLDVLRRHVSDESVDLIYLDPPFNSQANYIDALWGVVDREKAEIGVLLSFNEPTAGMRARAAEAGFYESPWGKHPRMQLRTVGELLAGKGIDYPHVAGANVTHRRAARAKAPAPDQPSLFPDGAES